MQEEFEKKVRERVHTFGIQPSREVWDEIDAVLDKQKHRRVFVGWWILLGLVVMGGTVMLLDKDTLNQGKINQHQLIITDTAANNSLAGKTEIARPDSNKPAPSKGNAGQMRNSLPLYEQADTAVAANHIPDAYAKGHAKSSFLSKGSFSFSSRLPVITEDAPPTDAATNDNKKDVIPQAVAKDTAAGNVLNAYPPAVETGTAPVHLLPSEADTTPKTAEMAKDSGTTVTALKQGKESGQNKPSSTNLKTIAQKKHEWFLMLSVGTTRTIPSNAFNTPFTASGLTSASYSYASIPAITALNLYNYNLSPPGTGFHVSAGAMYERELSLHWKVSGGLSFSYLTNTQQTGAVYKNPFYIAANNPAYASNGFSAAYPLVTLQSYYQSGSASTLVNKAWQAEIPVGMSFVFNPKSKTKFMLIGGLSYVWLFSSQWLIPDARYDKLYYSKEVFNNTSLNWQAGPAVQLGNQWKFGLQYQQSFTTLAKGYVSPKLNWQNISLYTAIPLGRKKEAGKRRGMAL